MCVYSLSKWCLCYVSRMWRILYKRQRYINLRVNYSSSAIRTALIACSNHYLVIRPHCIISIIAIIIFVFFIIFTSSCSCFIQILWVRWAHERRLIICIWSCVELVRTIFVLKDVDIVLAETLRLHWMRSISKIVIHRRFTTVKCTIHIVFRPVLRRHVKHIGSSWWSSACLPLWSLVMRWTDLVIGLRWLREWTIGLLHLLGILHNLLLLYCRVNIVLRILTHKLLRMMIWGRVIMNIHHAARGVGVDPQLLFLLSLHILQLLRGLGTPLHQRWAILSWLSAYIRHVIPSLIVVRIMLGDKSRTVGIIH